MVNRLVAVLSPRYELGDHRIVKGRHFAALCYAGINSQFFGKFQMIEGPDGRQKSRSRVLGIKPRLYCPAIDAQFILPLRQRFPARHPKLPLHQIDAGNFFRHGVFNLKPRVHFHEPDAVGAQALRCIRDKLDRSCADIIDCLGRLDCCRAELLACCFVHAGRRGFLDDFLVATLERAVAFEQVDDVAVRVAKHLHLDMARALDIFLDEYMRVAKRRRRLTLA